MYALLLNEQLLVIICLEYFLGVIFFSKLVLRLKLNWAFIYYAEKLCICLFCRQYHILEELKFYLLER